MLFTYYGRIQLRMILWITIGIPISLIYGVLIGDLLTPNLVILMVTVIGMVLDSLYDFLQSRTWDKDWPPLFVLLTGIVEFIVVLIVIVVSKHLLFFIFPFSLFFEIAYVTVTFHYWLVWIGMFAGMTVVIPILFPQAKFNGGRIFYQKV